MYEKMTHHTTSPTLEEIRYLMNCFMLLLIARPSSTAATMDAKLSSGSTISAADLATAVPEPIAIPICAFFMAGASSTPSPVCPGEKRNKSRWSRREKGAEPEIERGEGPRRKRQEGRENKRKEGVEPRASEKRGESGAHKKRWAESERVGGGARQRWGSRWGWLQKADRGVVLSHKGAVPWQRPPGRTAGSPRS